MLVHFNRQSLLPKYYTKFVYENSRKIKLAVSSQGIFSSSLYVHEFFWTVDLYRAFFLTNISFMLHYKFLTYFE